MQAHIETDAPRVQKMLKKAYPRLSKFWPKGAGLLKQDLEGETHAPEDGKDLLLLELHRTLHLC